MLPMLILQGYLAQDIDFESSLQMALKSTNSLGLTLTDDAHKKLFKQPNQSGKNADYGKAAQFGADGNNVDIDVELVELTETGIRYNAVSTGVRQKIKFIKIYSYREGKKIWM